MLTLCYSVRVKSLAEISAKAVRIETFDGRSDILPKSQIFGRDLEISKSDAYWISAWILDKKNIQYSTKKSRMVDVADSGKLYNAPSYCKSVVYHNPEYIPPVPSNEIESLRNPDAGAPASE